MASFTKAMAVALGALGGGVAGFYALEMYKIQSKEQRLALLLDKKKSYETSLKEKEEPIH
ncbi:hypothetical protein BDB01DRAFT_905962 [Pilobolus umbonatus]|nr:hypothetical protein BDB01DRAFT_905962 [Pilobolus umbonatus]